jgi:hypothetical protein
MVPLAHSERRFFVPTKMKYREELFQAIDAFLERTPSALERAQRIIQRCYTSLGGEEERITLNSILWGAFITPLTDSVFYEHEPFLRETREILQGSSSRHIARTVFKEDYRASFTTEEEHWYAQLVSMLEFIWATPFDRYAATHQAWQQRETWPTVRPTLPEAVLADKIDEEYWQRKALLEQIAASNLTPKDIGEEHIYHLLLQESPVS